MDKVAGLHQDYLEVLSELAIMRDSLKIGIFFMNKDYIIQSNYSGYLGAMFQNADLAGKSLLDIIGHRVMPSELSAIKDYFKMIFDESYEQYILDEINPLLELEFYLPGFKKPKYYQFEFVTVKRGCGEIFALVSVFDITSKVELRKQLQEEGSRRQEEMQAVFELIQIEPHVLDDFIEDMEQEFEEINNILSDDNLSEEETLIRVYQSIHSIKSNALTLEQNTFGDKVHKTEAKIKKIMERENITFNDMLNLTKDIEKLILQKENFKQTREKIKYHKNNDLFDAENPSRELLINSLSQTVKIVSKDLGKNVHFKTGEVDIEAIKNKNLRRLIKDIVIQLIRNSIVHGIEKSGVVYFSLKNEDGKIKIKLADNGKGFDYKKILEKADQLKLIKKENFKGLDSKAMENNEELLKAVFSPGFSTSEESMHGGRGIGLNMVRDRVRENKGTIKVQSETGKGTVFVIVFPK